MVNDHHRSDRPGGIDMRYHFGWLAALGPALASSPALASEEASLVQPEFDPFSLSMTDQPVELRAHSDFEDLGFAAPRAEADLAFGSAGWTSMLHGLKDSDQTDTDGDRADASFAGLQKGAGLGSMRQALVRAASEEQGGTASAGETDAPFDLSATVTLVSDYRFRGMSLSDRDPAIQGSVDVEHQSGFYVGVWGSTIAEFANAHTEVDVYGGWRGSLGGLDVDAGVTGYFYPNGQDATYFELTGSVGYTLGPAEMKLGIAYAPDQSNLGSDDSLYAYGQLKAGIPGTPVTLVAQAGHEEGAMGGPTGEKWDWSLGAQIVKDRFTLGLSYVDTDVDRLFDPDKVTHAGVVLSLSISI
jgi:uncharacterized protein (TIGR02001 family)